MELFLGFVFICLVLGAIGITYGKKDEEVIAPSRQRDNRPANISEPVISIVESFKEKGRWRITDQSDPYSIGFSKCYYSFSVKDTVTDEIYTMQSGSYIWLNTGWCRYRNNIRFPKSMVHGCLPSWMTEAEKKYVCERFEIISNKVAARIQLVEDRYRTKDEKQAKVNQDKERQRLMSLYCKEKTE